LPETKPVKGLVICFVQGSVLFFNSDNVKAQLDEIIDASLPDARWFALDASAITQIDATGLDMLQGIRDRLRRHGIVLAFTETQSNVTALLGRAGLSADDGSTLFFDDVEDAYRAFRAAYPTLQSGSEATEPSVAMENTKEEKA
jgi:MFS superfamily sulfate permease-like transporter